MLRAGGSATSPSSVLAEGLRQLASRRRLIVFWRSFADLRYTKVADACANQREAVASMLAHAHADLLLASEEGTVRLLSRHHSAVVVSVGKYGAFSTRLPPGRYRLEAGARGSNRLADGLVSGALHR